MGLLSSVLLLAAQASAVSDPVPGEVHNFKDWVVACDNGLRCQATSLVPELPAEGEAAAPAGAAGPAAPATDTWERFGALNVEWAPGPDGALAFTIGDFEGTPARLMVNDQPLEARLVATEDGEWRVEPRDRAAFLDQLYAGTMLVQDANGRTISELALDGLWQSLVYIEERQGRLGTTTAAMRRGRRPASLVPAAPALPVIQAAPRTSERALAIPAARLAEARRAVRCTQEEVGINAEDQDIRPLGNGRALIMMGCGSGAYNASTLPLVAWREGNAIRIEPARFDVWREPIAGEVPPAGYSVTNADFDPATLTISEYAKGRGIGDCGTAASYVWDGEMFRLSLRDEMSECRGSTALLTTWRAEVRR